MPTDLTDAQRAAQANAMSINMVKNPYDLIKAGQRERSNSVDSELEKSLKDGKTQLKASYAK